MYDYETKTRELFIQFLEKQKPYLSISLVNADNISSLFIDSLTNLYIRKFDKIFNHVVFSFIPPDFSVTDKVVQFKNLIGFITSESEKEDMLRLLVLVDKIISTYKSVRNLLKLSYFLLE
jgi:hypothetical protein